MRVLVIFARHGTVQYASSLADYRARLDRQLSGLDLEWLLVDTALPPGSEQFEDGVTLLGSSNDEWEFSAFDAALAFARPRLWDFDLVHLVTSAHGQLYTAYQDRITPEALSAIAGRAAALGHIDCYNAPVELLGMRSQHWLRTSCVFLPPAEAAVLGRCAAAGPGGRWFSGEADPLFRSDAPLSARYAGLIATWLTGGDIGQGVSWHSPLVANTASVPRLQAKALAVLNEHLLSARLRSAGCRTVDLTWLGTVIDHGAVPDLDTPWHEQVAGRDRDALHVTVAN